MRVSIGNAAICAALGFVSCQERTFQSEVKNSQQGPKSVSRAVSEIVGNIEQGWNTMYAVEGGARYDCRAKIEVRDGNLFAYVQESNQLRSTRLESGAPIDWKKIREFNFGPVPKKAFEGVERGDGYAFEYKGNGNYFYAEYKKWGLVLVQLASANIIVAEVNRIWCAADAPK